jgi:hypothetical protein
VLDLHGWGGVGEELNRLSKHGEWVAMGDLITDEMLDTFAVVAEPDSIAAGITARWGGVIDRISFDAPYPSDPEIWHAAVRELKKLAP